MAGKNTAVFGIYQNQDAVERAVTALKDAGFRSTDISVLFPANVGSKDFAHVKGTKAPEGATTGGAELSLGHGVQQRVGEAQPQHPVLLVAGDDLAPVQRHDGVLADHRREGLVRKRLPEGEDVDRLPRVLRQGVDPA